MKKQMKFISFGLVLGLFLGTAFGWWSWVHVHSLRHPPGKKWERKMNHFSRRLDLNRQQQTQITAIFKTKHKLILALHTEMTPRFQKIHRTAVIEIKKRGDDRVYYLMKGGTIDWFVDLEEAKLIGLSFENFVEMAKGNLIEVSTGTDILGRDWIKVGKDRYNRNDNEVFSVFLLRVAKESGYLTK